jgi:hypothetical protein
MRVALRFQCGALQTLQPLYWRSEMGRQTAATPSATRKPKAEKKPLTQTGEKAGAKPSAKGVDQEQAIREAAYACFEARGCEPGHELDDWLRAEGMVHEASDRGQPVRH